MDVSAIAGVNIRIVSMPIDDILTEIDSYLSELRQARDLLVPLIALRSKKPRRKTRNQKPTEKARKASPAELKKLALEEKERPSGRKSPTVRIDKKPATQPSRSGAGTVAKETVSRGAAEIEGVNAAAVEQKSGPESQATKVRTIPAKTIRRRTAIPARAKPENKPATALSGAMHSRIVVVPAEQLRKEREQAAATEAPRPRVFPSGLTGKRAFEALFKDAPEAGPARNSEKPEKANHG